MSTSDLRGRGGWLRARTPRGALLLSQPVEPPSFAIAPDALVLALERVIEMGTQVKI